LSIVGSFSITDYRLMSVTAFYMSTVIWLSDRKEPQIGQSRARDDASHRGKRRAYPLDATAWLGMMGTRRLMVAALTTLMNQPLPALYG
jgi:hypothetical protein